MAINSDAYATAAGQATGWLAGFMAMIGETTTAFDKAPLLAFMAMGILGSFAGWALMVETGQWDDRSGGAQAKSLVLRCGIGVAIGIAIGVYYLDLPAASRGIWMLVTGVSAAAPIDALQYGLSFVRRLTGGAAPKNEGGQ